MNVLSEVLGDDPEPWVIMTQRKGSKSAIACSSYSDERKAKEEVKSLNQIHKDFVYWVVHHSEIECVGNKFGETNEELLARYALVKEKFHAAKAAAERCKPGGTRDRKMRWAGCLNFTLGRIETKMEERGLKHDCKSV